MESKIMQKEAISAEYGIFRDYGYILVKVPDDVLSVFKDQSKRIKAGTIPCINANNKLAGQITNQFNLDYLNTHPLIVEFFGSLAKTYIEIFKTLPTPSTVKGGEWSIVLESLWINIQEKGEYNPIHAHNGVFSFVVWLEIPFTIEEEQQLPNSKNSNKPSNGDFYFHFVKNSGEIDNVPMKVGKDKEGYACFFNSGLYHSVNPYFSTEEKRVTISGNMYYKQVDVQQ